MAYLQLFEIYSSENKADRSKQTRDPSSCIELFSDKKIFELTVAPGNQG